MFNRNYLVVAVLVALMMASCIRSPKNPGREYIPDMGRDVAYEAYYKNPGKEILPLGMNAQLPPETSISTNDEVYPHPNSVDGYNAAGDSYVNEFTFTDQEITGEGNNLYVVYCAICHGATGEGNGHLTTLTLAMGGEFPRPPSYFREDIVALPEGKRYHSVMYGKGMMGSYATQLDHRERWLVLSYVKSLQDAQLAKAAQ